MYIAHKREINEKETQALSEHLYGTEKRCMEFGKAFDNGDFAAECGILHDIGKYSTEFQLRINGKGKKCDHSTAGARIAYRISLFGKLAAYCIAGHHSGLQDSGTMADSGGEGTLYARLSEEYIIPAINGCQSEIDITKFKLMPKNIRKLNGSGGFTFAFFTHMIYSCLTDSDFLDTEEFMKGKERLSVIADFKVMKELLDAKLKSFPHSNDIVNKKRAEILQNCISKANLGRGLYNLTVPTGGGKTISSMAFALNHLIANGHRRIIYVIPYTSIIEQNAKVFSDIFGTDYILEHHSNYDFNREEEPENLKYLASENWDMPIIITTNVQFFESMFSNKSSRNRKLHNIANSVIIFDEVQMFPTEYLKPCIAVLSELTYNYNCTAVLCSATQPALDQFFPIKPIEICEDNENNLFRAFTRTKVEMLGESDSVSMAECMMSKDQCLTIVNTRKHAKKIYDLLTGEGNFHLSTLMCPVHRLYIIKEIRERLRMKQPCRVISTRLIEAGVDVDFPFVYRALCGLDSIIQSAGRCNREGRMIDEQGNTIMGKVYIFKPEEEFYKHMPSSMTLPIEITKEIIRNYEDIMSPEAIETYFNQLYFCKGEEGLDSKGILKKLETGVPEGKPDLKKTFNYNFKQIAEEFKLIEEHTFSVIIPYDENAIKLIDKLNFVDELRGVLRSLQPYTVNIFKNEFEALNGAGKLKIVAEDMAVLRSIDDYNNQTGINIDIKSGIGVFY
jgi:CRISPR-associated helicase Cas3/CRISPR-associated endonuclease Cas3-HD